MCSPSLRILELPLPSVSFSTDVPLLEWSVMRIVPLSSLSIKQCLPEMTAKGSSKVGRPCRSFARPMAWRGADSA